MHDNALPTQEVAKRRQVVYVQGAGTCYAHAMVNAILMSPMREMMVNMGDRLDSSESSTFLAKVHSFVEDCWHDDSVQGSWELVQSWRQDLQAALGDLSSEQAEAQKDELEAVVLAEEAGFIEMMNERFNQLIENFETIQFETMIALVMARICKNMQQFDTVKRPPSRNIKVDWLYALVCGKFPHKSIKPNAYVDVGEGASLDEGLIDYLFACLGEIEGNEVVYNTDKVYTLHMQGEAYAAQSVKDPPVALNNTIDGAAVSGTMFFRGAGHAVAWANLDGRLVVYDSNLGYPSHLKTVLVWYLSMLRAQAPDAQIWLPTTDDAAGDADYVLHEWHNPNAATLEEVNDQSFALYFVPQTKGGAL